jgi:hypothetical protein
MAEAGAPFGSCCEKLKEALAGGDFEPLITVGSNDVIYVTIGLFASDEGQPALVDHVLFYCPFCGTKVQTPEEVEAKAAHEDEGEEEPRQA